MHHSHKSYNRIDGIDNTDDALQTFALFGMHREKYEWREWRKWNDISLFRLQKNTFPTFELLFKYLRLWRNRNGWRKRVGGGAKK